MIDYKSACGKNPSGNGTTGGEGEEHQKKRSKHEDENDDGEDEEEEEVFVPTKVEKDWVLNLAYMPSSVESALETAIPHEAAKQALAFVHDQQKVIKKGRAAYDSLYNEYCWTHENLQDAEETFIKYKKSNKKLAAEVTSLEESQNRWKIKTRKAAAANKQLAKAIREMRMYSNLPSVESQSDYDGYELSCFEGCDKGSEAGAAAALSRAIQILNAYGL
jgi:hypothetical protein